jgi:C-terminal processing protease CtpA/Prc
LIQNTGRGKIVGYETNGGKYSGNGFSLLKYVLPKTGFQFGFPYVNIIYSNGSAKTGKGIIPDYLVEDDLESFQNNKDRQLNFIIDSLIKN